MATKATATLVAEVTAAVGVVLVEVKAHALAEAVAEVVAGPEATGVLLDAN